MIYELAWFDNVGNVWVSIFFHDMLNNSSKAVSEAKNLYGQGYISSLPHSLTDLLTHYAVLYTQLTFYYSLYEPQ